MNLVCKVGDEIVFEENGNKHVGMCIIKTSTFVTLLFTRESSFYKKYSMTTYKFMFLIGYTLYLDKTYTKEEKIANKIKYLWNNSKYVKQFGVQY